MERSEYDSFVRKFKNLSHHGRNATLIMKTKSGKTTLNLQVVLEPRPEQGHQVLALPQHQHPRNSRNSPSQVRRRQKLATARKVAADKAIAEISEEELALLKLAEEAEVRAKAADAVTTASDPHEGGNQPEDLEKNLEEDVLDEMCSDQEYFRPQPTLPEFRRTPSQNGGLTLEGF